MKARIALFLAVGLLWTAADLATKSWAHEKFSRGQKVPVMKFLNWTSSENKGAAFGLLDSAAWGRPFLTFVSIAAIVFLFWLVIRTDDRPMVTAATLGLVLGGVVGNVYDRMTNVNGAVRDFIDFHIGDWHWHTFNIADSGITVGVLLLLLLGVLPRKRAAPAEEPHPAHR